MMHSHSNFEDMTQLTRYLQKLIANAQSDAPLSSDDRAALSEIAQAVYEYITQIQSANTSLQSLLHRLQSYQATITPPTPAGAQASSVLNGALILKSGEELPPAAVKTAAGKRIPLGIRIGSGGEGEVFKLPDQAGKVAKLYRTGSPLCCDKQERKLKLLIEKQAASYMDQKLVATLPEELLYTEDGKFIGYIMPQCNSTVKIYSVERETDRKQLFPAMTYTGLIAIAYNLASVVAHLHKNDVIIGDFNQNNILVNADGTVCLIDCDSFDVTDPISGEHFPCTVGYAELLAPELQTKQLSRERFTKECDYFTLAIHIFRLLMLNADPFSSTPSQTSSRSTEKSTPANGIYDAILNGECVYVRSIPHKTIPSWSMTMEFLPKQIQELFGRVFDYDANSFRQKIAHRPTPVQWKIALLEFHRMQTVTCPKDPSHVYMASLGASCPFCKRKINHAPKNELDSIQFSMGL